MLLSRNLDGSAMALTPVAKGEMPGWRLVSVVVFLSILAINGCASYQLKTFKPLERNTRGITVPPGGGGLVGALKSVLREEGWQLVIYRIEGSIGKKTRVEEYDTFTTRYRLLVSDDQYDWCLPLFDPAYHYDVSLLDNRNGDEVMTLSGSGCENKDPKSDQACSNRSGLSARAGLTLVLVTLERRISEARGDMVGSGAWPWPKYATGTLEAVRGHTEAGKRRSVTPLDEARQVRISTSLAQSGG